MKLEKIIEYWECFEDEAIEMQDACGEEGFEMFQEQIEVCEETLKILKGL